MRVMVAPIVDEFAEVSVRLEREQDLLQREQVLVADAGTYLRQVESAAERLVAATPRFLPAASRLQAQSALAALVERAAARVSIRITQLGFSAASPADDRSPTVGIDIQGEGDLEGLLNFIGALEAGPVLLTIDQLHVSAAQPLRQHETDSVPLGETLSFRAWVSGHYLLEEGKADGLADLPRLEDGERAHAAILTVADWRTEP